MTDTLIETLKFTASDKKTLELFFGNGESIIIKNDDEFLITDDGWMIFESDVIRLDSVYKFSYL